MEIRRATPNDKPVMRTLWDEFNAETTYTPYPGSEFAESLLTDQLAFIAEDDGEPVGCVFAATPSDYYGFVFGLYVRPTARRGGLARRLMNSVAAELQRQGKRYIVLSVDTPNAAARTLYDDLGFIDAARTLRVDIEELLGGHS
jgi:ribosomal protein S18 acetylase RimI-like enzyme